MRRAEKHRTVTFVWCVGIVPFWLCFHGFEGKKLDEMDGVKVLELCV